jgi:hypothetical protein
MKHSADDQVEAIARKMANDLMAQGLETAVEPASNLPSPDPSLELPTFLDRRKTQVDKRKTKTVEVTTTSREAYESKFPNTRMPRTTTVDRTSQKLIQLQASFTTKGPEATIEAARFDEAIRLLRNDVGDMLSAFGCEWALEVSPDRLREMLRVFVLTEMKFRGSGVAKTIKLK